ncbi:hypothetical protein [Tritonibacter mobilis]|uniref:hypothetical protein n=1 Tax=Tritonibacter mobilis TaxID=379347 RepID=UPI001C08FD24|nr:hypothetical protein [Tritonibacter mobilis]MBU3032672.1 hypothetical protein [Tritonibacter mobilis]WHQ81870.1 hypothetical protein OMR53_11745 [Tritonibacter mobilis]
MHPSEISIRRPKRSSASRKASVTTRDTNKIFDRVNAAAAGQLRHLAESWLGKTRLSGDNLFALNPTRADKKIGSFSINIRKGVWADFATGDAGGDIISFYSYIHGVSQIEAARALAEKLGVR